MPKKSLEARVVVGGSASGEALVSRQPFNFTAAHTKPANLLPYKKAEVADRHHELFGSNLRGKIVVVPSCIGSTHTGLVLLELVSRGIGPAGLIVGCADSLLVSGVILSEVWFGRSIPVLEYASGDLFDHIKTGDPVTIDGERVSIG